MDFVGLILVVDDDRLDLDLAETGLVNYGYRVVKAATGSDGLRLAFERTPDLILIDMALPDMAGLEACRRLRDDGRTVDVPIMFLTSPENIGDVVQGLEAGGDGYITKPFNPRELVARVKSALRLKALNDTLKALNRELAERAITDGSTGLLNKAHMDARGAEELARAQRYGAPLSLLMLDVDHFKEVNDAYGHPVGDAVLRELAKVLRLSTRSVDLVGRYGGEEFLIILPQTDGAGTRTLANRLRLAVETHKFAAGTEGIGEKPDACLTITVSIGGYTLPQPSMGAPAAPADAAGGPAGPAVPRETWASAVKAADDALYEAKKAGRNKVVIR